MTIKSARAQGGTVYLLHFTSPLTHARHYLGCARPPTVINVAAMRHGRGWKALEGAGVQLADVWELDSWPATEELYARLKRQGGRARICSICNPGNGRGNGKGRYERRKD